jgi:hypothetical protein
MDRPTENSASNSVTVLLRSNVLLVTMEMKSTSHCIATDICRLSFMWEAPTQTICRNLIKSHFDVYLFTLFGLLLILCPLLLMVAAVVVLAGAVEE